jgi:hypothetical protein
MPLHSSENAVGFIPASGSGGFSAIEPLSWTLFFSSVLGAHPNDRWLTNPQLSVSSCLNFLTLRRAVNANKRENNNERDTDEICLYIGTFRVGSIHRYRPARILVSNKWTFRRRH